LFQRAADRLPHPDVAIGERRHQEICALRVADPAQRLGCGLTEIAIGMLEGEDEDVHGHVEFFIQRFETGQAVGAAGVE